MNTGYTLPAFIQRPLEHPAIMINTIDYFVYSLWQSLTLQNNNILEYTKLQELADYKINVIQKLKFVMGREGETVWEKEIVLVTSIFSFTNNVFKTFLFQICEKLGLCGNHTTLSFNKPLENGKTLWVKKKMLKTSIFTSSHIAFNPLTHYHAIPTFDDPGKEVI